ncbi:Replication factor C subunit 1 [Neolecta irregularis DAH-3]|uniref:Replication factor C subunit 1 n=1 Tax=Neolecta irregularis (strain DAH-3) TaxID=1198029 RepID=A0A1U7LNI0_NEOID|nr:Replication factor C subunit 1 [Neolecta irregularis DAH-3]|eukprot:OLL24207.1 Replication factor C subunit 1 [Neolecta irregularis DAH-3]
MPTDIRNYFGNKSSPPKSILSGTKNANTPKVSKEDSKTKKAKKRIIVSDDDDEADDVPKVERGFSDKSPSRKQAKKESEFEPTDVPSYFASSNKVNRTAPLKKAIPKLPKKPKIVDEDHFIVPDDFDDDMSIDNDIATKDEQVATTKSNSRKRKATESPVIDLDNEEKAVQPKSVAKKTSPKKSTSRVKKPRVSNEQHDDDPDSAKIKAILDDIPTGFNYRDFASRGGPAAQGSKEIPVGAENCLSGLSFVLTGVLETIARDDASDLIKRHGGKVMSAPSSKTDFVVLGSEAGPKKLETIAKHCLRTIDEDGLFQLIGRLPANGGSGKQAQLAAAKREAEDKKAKEMAEEMKPKTDAAKILAKSQLWTDKYAPSSLKDICGNKGLVEKLQRWLRDWPKYINANFKKPGPDGSGLYRAVLVSGPPGIGKTTACHLVAKLEGYDILEFNASDTRSKRLMDEQLRGVTDNTSLNGYFAADARFDPTKLKLVIIMDEVDGMSGGDRGGVGQLNVVIKHTKIPVICICNDRKHQKLKPLDRTTLDIPFKRPTAQDMRSRLMSIAYREQLKLEPQAIDQLVAGTHNDIRQIINLLSTYRLSNSSMTMDQGKVTSRNAQKHIILKPWDIVGKFLSGGIFHSTNKITLNEKIELYFNDHEFSYLMVQENYLKTNPDLARRVTGPPKEVNMKKLELAEKAAESISDADLVDAMIHGPQQHWSLMPVHGVFSCVRPCSFVHGAGVGGQYSFTSWLGNNSKQGKTMRLLREIQSHMRLKTSGDKNEIRQSYLPLLFNRLSCPLIDEGVEAVPDIIETMDEYFLTKEDWDSIMELGIGLQSGEQVLKRISTATKSAFTRKYNQANHPIPFMKASTVMPTKAGAIRDVPDLEDAVEASDVDAILVDENLDDNDDDDISKDKMVKSKALKPRKTASAKATTKKSKAKAKANSVK